MTSKPIKQPTDPTEQQIKETKQEQPLTVLHVQAPTQLPTRSDEAIETHLAQWGGSGGRLFAFNGSTGIYRTLDDDVEVPCGTKFVALLHETRKGFIKFSQDGGPPD